MNNLPQGNSRPWLSIVGMPPPPTGNVMVPTSCIFIPPNPTKGDTTFKYVFLDLEDCPIEVPLMITLICSSGGHDDSSTFPFNFSSL